MVIIPSWLQHIKTGSPQGIHLIVRPHSLTPDHRPSHSRQPTPLSACIMYTFYQNEEEEKKTSRSLAVTHHQNPPCKAMLSRKICSATPTTSPISRFIAEQVFRLFRFYNRTMQQNAIYTDRQREHSSSCSHIWWYTQRAVDDIAFSTSHESQAQTSLYIFSPKTCSLCECRQRKKDDRSSPEVLPFVTCQA